MHYLKIFEKVCREKWSQASLCNYQGTNYSYSDVAVRIERFHILFKNAGVKKADRVAICGRNCANWALSFLASNTYETVTVPILADFLPQDVASLVNHSGSRVLFADPEIWEKMDASALKELRMVISIRDFSLLYSAGEMEKNAFEGLDMAYAEAWPLGFTAADVCYPDGNENDLALINYTSGTTSAPKGVMLTYGNMCSTVDFSQKHVPVRDGDKLVSMLPLAHMYGLAEEFLYPVCSGVTVYFLGKTPSPTLLMKAMADVRPYIVVTVPLVLEKVYKSSIKPAISKWYMKVLLHIPFVGCSIYGKIGKKLQAAFGGKVRSFIMGGAALNPEVEKCFRKIRLPYTVGYGMTEASPLLAWESCDKYVAGSCGKPCHQVRIDSADPQNVPGEIQAMGPNLCMGYYRNDEANKALFTEDGWLRTGDLGVMDADGNIFIRGRSKSMILSANGQNIYPEELEAVVNTQQYVVESVVVDRDGKLVALVYLDTDAIKRDGLDEAQVAVLTERIMVMSNRRLPAYSRLTRVERVDAPFEKTPKMSIKRFKYK